ncbi:MAG: ABC transporter substrate-binding protein [Oscillospiraceae bacterium]|nr:ABC transporter substrate-binding protein [Oscillospiraceae bacterium]
MRLFKRLLCGIMVGILALGLIACNSKPSEVDSPASESPISLHIAYQYGLAYAPLIICQENKLIEKAVKEATGKDAEISWDQMSSGADINVGIASGNIDVGFMGIAPAITGISKNVGYKIFTNLSGQEHGMMTNDSEISSLADIIGSSKQVALVNIGSIQHIILGLALSANGYDAHALDSNLVAMKHPDGMTALESNSIACHLTSNPYIYKERNNDTLHEISEVKDCWSTENSFIVGVASTSRFSENPEVYDALCSAIAEAIDFINNDIESAAKITCEYNGNSYEDELFYLQAGNYSSETKGVFELAQFMFENAFIEKGFEDYSDLVFSNVKGS